MLNIFTKTLNRKLLAAFLFIGVAPLVLVGVTIIDKSKNEIQGLAISGDDFLIRQKMEVVDNYFDRYTNLIKMTYEFPPIQGIIRAVPTGIDPVDNSSLQQWTDRLATIFSSVASSDKAIYDLTYFDEKGNAIVSVKNTEDMVFRVSDSDLDKRSSKVYFSEIIALGKGELYVSSIDLNRVGDKIQTPHLPIIRVGVPVYEENSGNVKGALIIAVRAGPMLDTIRKGDIGKTVLIDEKGEFLLHFDKNKEFGSLLGKGINYFQEAPELEQNLRAHLSKRHHDISDKEFRTWHKIFYNPNTEDQYWVLLSVVKERDLFAPIFYLKRAVLFISILIVGIVIVISLMMSRSISKPIIGLKDVSEKVSSGDLTVQIKHEYLQMRDEIGDLARGFQTMIGNLNELLKGIRQATHQVSKSASDIAVVSQEQSSGVQEQSSAIAETTAAAKELATSSESVGDNIKDVMETNHSTLDGMQRMKGAVEKVSQKINLLNEKTKQIGNITNLIDDVADQTNLLAINAAIEAARAGEQGKGFTVVADEIRKLSDSTGKSTKDITALIEIIHNEMSNSLIAMEESMSIVEEQVGLSEVSANKSQEISSSASEQISGAKQIAEAMSSINEAMKQVTDAAKEAQQSSKDLDVLSQQFKEMSEKFTIR